MKPLKLVSIALLCTAYALGQAQASTNAEERQSRKNPNIALRISLGDFIWGGIQAELPLTQLCVSLF